MGVGVRSDGISGTGGVRMAPRSRGHESRWCGYVGGCQWPFALFGCWSLGVGCGRLVLVAGAGVWGLDVGC